MPKLTRQQWAQAKRAWENDPEMTLKDVAKMLNVSENAVTYQKKSREWAKNTPAEEAFVPWSDPDAEEPHVEFEAPPVSATIGAETVGTVASVPHPSDKEDALLAEIEDLKAKLDEAEAEKQRLSPVTNVSFYTTAESVQEFFGEEVMREKAYHRLSAVNRERFHKGLPQLDHESNPHIVAETMEQIAKDLAARKTKWRRETATMRVVKMMRPDGNIVQIAVEEQINNEAGQQGAAVWKARDKGLKLVTPYLCQMLDCWNEASADDHGNLTRKGYCSDTCLARDPYLNSEKVPGVVTSRVGSMSG